MIYTKIFFVNKFLKFMQKTSHFWLIERKYTLPRYYNDHITVKKIGKPPPVTNTKPFTLWQCFPKPGGIHFLTGSRRCVRMQQKRHRLTAVANNRQTHTLCEPTRQLIIKTKPKRSRRWHFRFFTLRRI